MTKKFNAFTLAEVLITLGIIGVVAAMTMPTLINQTNGAQYRAAYKKALSAISQGVTLNVALDDISFADTDTPSSTASTAGQKSIAGLLMSRMNVVKVDDGSKYTDFPKVSAKVCTEGTGKDEKVKACGDDDTPKDFDVKPDVFLYFNNSSMFAIYGADKACTNISTTGGNKTCFGVIDVNGLKGPNKLVTCDKNASETDTSCTVTSPTDIYPVKYYDQTILPSTPAAEAVLYGK